MTIITITTDFGLRDGYVGVMKGVIWGINPSVKIVDITHLIPPQSVGLGGIALQRVVPFFPAGTIHLAVVDPGVGTKRRAMAAKIGQNLYVAPDNGLLTRIINNALKIGEEVVFVDLDQPKYWLSEISHVFHGRDIFAPVAAHLSNGVDINEVGTPFQDPILLTIPEPELQPDRIFGEVISIDNFGNLATNIFVTHLSHYDRKFVIKIKDTLIPDFVETFGDRSTETLVGMMGTQNDFLIASVNSNAQRKLDAKIGDKVEILFGKL